MGKSGDQGALVSAIVAGRTLREIATLAGVSISTVQRRLKEPGILAEVRLERTRQRQEVVGRLGRLRSSALARLEALVEHENSAIALRAVGLALSASHRMDIAWDFEQRLAALEEPFDEPSSVADIDVA